MTPNRISHPNPLWEKSSESARTGTSIRRFPVSRERSLLEMMSLSDWYKFAPESLGLLLVISFIRPLLSGENSGSGNMPHPFWIPVLLMSSQYGIMGGLFATLAAAAALFLNGLPEQSATQDFYAYAGTVAAQPCAWFATALILGGLRTLHIHQATDLQARLNQTELVAEDLAGGLKRAVSEIERLELRIAANSSTVAALLHSFAELDFSDRRRLLGSVADVIRYGVGATSFTIYLKGARGLEPWLVVEDNSRVTSTTIPPPASSLFNGIRDVGFARDTNDCSNRLWAPIQRQGAAEPLGVLVCNLLLPSQDPAIAMCRIKKVCRVLAALLSVCPEPVSRVCRDERA